MKTIFTKSIAVKDIYLKDTSVPAGVFQHGEIIKAGESFDVMIKKYDDGRKYYTAFKKIGENYFCFTSMRNAEGQVYPNCGGMQASEELSRYFKQKQIINQIDYITDVDYVPFTFAEYNELPEPHRRRALRLLNERKLNFNNNAEDRKRSFA